ncbi:MAG TPA: choice-of-anchor tandem repeat GloVer-containing protein [Aequorivita sp.]|nr:choice-of-anchor tandem repeat GloVer-containing protein [Aequorivita sp.]
MKRTLSFSIKAMLFTLLFFQPFLGFSQTLTKLFDFNGSNGSRAFADLISDGTYFYGTTVEGGNNDIGVLFKIKIDGTGYTKLHDFDETNGANPFNGLTLVGTELFGVTLYGGPNDKGVIFKINTDGTNYTILNDLSGNSDGSLPNASLNYDGTFLYGTTYSGGTGAGGGTIYKLKPDGTEFTTIHSFNGSNTINGAQPQEELLFDGSYFYGVTFNGGINTKGVLYKIKPDGTDFSKLHDFNGANNTNNVEPSEPILVSGYLYGCTFLGGTNEYGTIYKVNTDGTDFSVLHDFDLPTGAKPHAKLTFAGDYLYGTTSSGGISGGGILFKIKPDGTDYTNLYEFGTDSGYGSYSALLYQGTFLYGITSSGGSNNDNGTIFQLDDALPLSAPNFVESSSVYLFPNPLKDMLNISLAENKETEIKLYDISGKLILTKTINSSATLDFNSLKSGVYVIQIENGSYKLVKE